MGIMPAILKNVDNEKAIRNKLKVIFLFISYISFYKSSKILTENICQKNKEIVLSGVEPESQVPETRMIAITP